MMKADHDAAQGDGHWKTVLRHTFERVSKTSGYTLADLAAITAPTLILVGDRDQFCTAEEAVTAYRALKHGELGVLPATGHIITPAAIDTTIDFFEQHR